MTRSRFQIERSADKRTVWVNGSDGCCLGRFGPSGVDVHKTALAQMASGEQCLTCFERGENQDVDWERFLALMSEHHGCTVPGRFKPS